MKGGCQTPGILQVSRAVWLGSYVVFQERRMALRLAARGSEPQARVGGAPPLGGLEGRVPPQWVWRMEHRATGRLFFSLAVQWHLPCYGLELARDPSPLSSFAWFPLRTGTPVVCLSQCCFESR